MLLTSLVLKFFNKIFLKKLYWDNISKLPGFEQYELMSRNFLAKKIFKPE